MSRSKIILTRLVVARVPSLLPMLYKVSELALELGIAERTLRDWLMKGAPCFYDHYHRIWINGENFAKWIKSIQPVHKIIKLSSSQAYCMKCNQAVEMTNIQSVPIKGKLIQHRGICPHCGTKINRGDRIGKVNQSI